MTLQNSNVVIDEAYKGTVSRSSTNGARPSHSLLFSGVAGHFIGLFDSTKPEFEKTRAQAFFGAE